MAISVFPSSSRYGSHYYCHFHSSNIIQQKSRRKPNMMMRVRMMTVSYEEGKLERPNWAGETPLSRLVASLISFKPLYSLMKFGARQVLISTAEKNDVPWRLMTKEILESDVYKEMESTLNPSVVYPDYYLNPFHAYDEGNLSWLAAAEAEAATLSIAKRALPDASSINEAMEIIRGNWLNAMEQHHQQYSGNLEIRDILDIGCSVGVSTRYLADKFPNAKLTGLDLSPYFLAVAKYKEKRSSQTSNKFQWIHANGENTGLESQSFDMVSIAYVLHECPARAIKNLVKEAFRLLRPGGTFAITDNSPKSKILQGGYIEEQYVSCFRCHFSFQKNPPALALCPATNKCVSTSENISDLVHYAPPWNYNPNEGRGSKKPVSKEVAVEELLEVIKATKPDNFTPRIVEKKDDYIRVEYESPILGFVDDVEFWFPPGKKPLVQYRSASRIGLGFDAN